MHIVKTVEFKMDAYLRCRGTPALISISCAHCDKYLMVYQKDGPGPLLRCYLDRIHHPEPLENRQHDLFDKRHSPVLECSHCKAVIGVPMIYKKENRPAYRMRKGLFKIKRLYK
jgi:hypothetical protein